ncbi:MAG: DHH family phosphoesterase [Oscillospiraceae bacterium]|nr:DHH family phosphoesterase [Oscillospiraceae bacterium]
MKGKKWLLFQVTGAALVFTAFCSAAIIIKDSEILSWTMLFVTAIVSFIFIMQFVIAQKNIHKYIAEVDEQINNTERETIYNFPAPTIIVDENGKIVWFNKRFMEYIYESGDPFGVNIQSVIPELDLEKAAMRNGTIIECKEKYYRVCASVNKKDDIELRMLYFEDVTEYVLLEEEFKNTRPAVMLVTLDNYEDLLQSIKESDKARILIQIEKLMESFIEENAGILRKTAADKFLIILEEQKISSVMENRFKILDNARQIVVDDKMTVTLSIGVGRGGNLIESEDFAKQALDMALGRGGDQAAVKTENDYQFFGGVSKGIEKQTKVKTRMIAKGIMGLIEESTAVYIMGHRFGDLDSIGSAVGLAEAVRNMGKAVSVVVNAEDNLAIPLIDRINEMDENAETLFITPDEAVSEITPTSLLIIVDTHNQDIVESPELYRKAKQVVVIDHHRKMTNYIENAVIFHHEPYASSASEMVTELVQYFGDAGKLSQYSAEALLSGIMLDTKSFVMRTGVRTFEAAAYLRKMGADTVAVRSLFANSMESYHEKTKLVASAEVYERCAIATNETPIENIKVVAPQAADELLGIAGVDAAFVIYMNNGMACFSARSLGAMNVQIVMEKLGGGGHQTMAGAQIEGMSLSEAKDALINAIDQHRKEIS